MHRQRWRKKKTKRELHIWQNQLTLQSYCEEHKKMIFRSFKILHQPWLEEGIDWSFVVCSSGTSSVMVAKAGKFEGFLGRIMGAGATSIHELKFLIPLAIDESVSDSSLFLLLNLERRESKLCVVDLRKSFGLVWERTMKKLVWLVLYSTSGTLNKEVESRVLRMSFDWDHHIHVRIKSKEILLTDS